MQLGKLKLENNLILAPLLNISTGPYRRFCRHFGAIGLVSVPMLYSKRFGGKSDSIEHELFKIEKEKPISVQLIGPDTESVKMSVDFLNSYDFNILDFNAGCPSRRAINSKEGGYLLKDIDLLKAILNTIIKYSNKPVSLKMRTGFYKPNVYLKIGKIAEDLGLEFITLHGRTVTKRFQSTTVELETIKKLKESLSIPVVGNGDIFDPESAKKMLDYTGVDAIMIGRGSMGNPQIFSAIETYLKTGEKETYRVHKDLLKKMIEIYENCIDSFLSGINYPYDDFKFVELKRNSLWLSKFMKNATVFRNNISRIKTLYDFKRELDNFLSN